MGYACPVCEAPQRDGEHLANHMAFTAMLHGDDHQRWLDEHAPDWDESAPAELAEAVSARAEEAEYEEVFEDTAHDHGHDRGHPLFDDGADAPAGAGGRGREGFDAAAARRRGGAAGTAETEEVLREARELTRRMREGADGDDDGGEGADGDDGGGEGAEE